MRSVRFLALRIAAAVLLAAAAASGDGILVSWGPQDLQGVSKEAYEAAKKASATKILEEIRTLRTWPEAYLAGLGASRHRDDTAFLLSVARLLTDSTETPLSATSRLIIWPRITSGDIVFEGQGMQVSDDLFCVAGRANWILRNVTGKNFGYVAPHPSAEALEALEDRWLFALHGGKAAQYADPFRSPRKGLEVLRSPEAVEALVASLRASRGKDERIRWCLEHVYGRKTMPQEPGQPGALCDPDVWTRRYLQAITDAAQPHDAAWWALWWKKNRGNLRWDAETARFTAGR
jgi:hypothetical protein